MTDRRPIGLTVPYRKKQDTDHCVFTNNVLKCLRCDGTFTLDLPMDIDDLAKKTKAFISLHKDCKEKNK